MIEQSSGNRWSIVWQWVVAVGVTTFLAAAAGLFGLWSIGDALEAALGEAAAYAAAGAFFGALVGLGVAAGSAPFLQPIGVSAGRWIGATVAGGAAGMAIALPLFLVVLESATMPQLVSGIVMGLALGIPIGAVQTALLRSRGLAGGWWGALTLAAFVAATGAATRLGGEGREWLALGAMSLLYAGVTGVGALRLQSRTVGAS